MAYSETARYSPLQGLVRLAVAAASFAWGLHQASLSPWDDLPMVDRGQILLCAEVGMLLAVWTLVAWIVGQRVEAGKGRVRITTWRRVREVMAQDIIALEKVALRWGRRWLDHSDGLADHNDGGRPWGLRIRTRHRSMLVGVPDPDAVVAALRRERGVPPPPGPKT